MKKLLAILLAALLLTAMIALTGCGNMAVGIGYFEYQRIHVDMYHYSGCLTVEKWHNNETGIEVKTQEAGSLFLSEGTYILLEGDRDCPFCGSTK
jgi:hypothetical protein